ncbi:molecular chaperone DnaK [Rubrivivax gelatinosus]|uniref:Molecular chaperone DnaK n=1 Tax=Rubrivivax gelatinosus TaxID=28068 RepID=A0ABS1DYJ5_RUBGE|nr:TraR/DksA C4-type zinc finger protein [Rubrivivax gelatinosus]MBK1613328.1 molecular chaperone DnaK [Rubrivivax gelatinosus]MBK1714623.1 molecular chaperone DnaK [Rubrivivax gelatinosus]MBZ8144080.1 molecular chaperone DnaK [Rubrivivax gelatinosus]
MSTHLTAGQQALLEAALVQRQHQLDRRLEDHHRGLSRVEHARELREQDHDDQPQREDERDVDMALSDLELREVGAVSAALRRLHAGDYGRCADCDAEIPFDRLKAEPWALRCVACEGQRERAPRP